ncbi:DEAD-box ATP-dependent RNA helicase 28 [Striga hermonthica]|uniref:DEAD-box ATP-dependent RNA helicase 28 n=1 Tax=Striga hermonthica TaxID=68872 RepID=A0A9N7RTE4_STRHE|nr:DEAD-box ATP-dependent RNA helicase 28 [Striga hermonthica]
MGGLRKGQAKTPFNFPTRDSFPSLKPSFCPHCSSAQAAIAMATSKEFVFEAPSDEEIENESESESDEEVEEEEAQESERKEEKVPKNKKAQSPWDFSSYSESVADEHSRRSTTSIDYKIGKARERLPITAAAGEDNGSGDSDSEPNLQEEYRPEEEDDVPTTSGNDKPFFATVEGVTYHANSFLDLNLSRPLLRACEALGYSKPTPIQAACIPLALTGRDICGSAITGSGKTAAFALPTLERLFFRPKNRPAIRVLILTPTRELAVQIHSMIGKLAQFMTDIRCCLVVGGLSTKVQEAALRSLPDIVVATPGRMIDHLRNSMSVHLDELAVLILDEADRLLELGFSAEIHELVKLCPKRRQTMLFSATMTERVDELVKLSLVKPLRLSADPSTKRPSALTEEVVRIRRTLEGNQEAVLLALCSKTFTSKVIIFSGTKKAAHRLKILFGLSGFKAAELHGDLTQAQRLDALELFRKQQVDFLIATDVAARGLDIIGVQTVINFACPRDLTSYVHRVGRTARAGREGYAVTFVTDDDRSLLKAIVKKAGSRLRSRIVAEQSIRRWSQMIEQMEDEVSSILLEEREEMALRKAEMEATKAENMIAHKDEIYSRPKRTWFVTEKEKKLVAKEAKEALGKRKGSGNEAISAEQAEELKMKEKRKREREKNLPRKKRRKLEAAREMLEEEEEVKGKQKSKEDKTGISLVDVAYRRAKAVKAAKRAVEAGKIVKKSVKKPNQVRKSRSEEMQELFEGDMSEKRQKRTSARGGGKRKSSFKSKSRYKRR